MVLVVQSIRGGTETVKAECLLLLFRHSLNALNNLVNFRVLIIEGLAVDEGVFSDPFNDLLVVFSAHLHATDGQFFDLGKEIVVWLGDNTLVILVSLKELHVQFS